MRELNRRNADRLMREISSFLRAGIPLPDGLVRLARDLDGTAAGRFASNAAERASQGETLSSIIGGQVPAELAALVECGERSGDLPGMLDYAVDHSRRVARHRDAITTAMFYPFVVIVAMLVVTSFILVYITPKFKEIYDQLGAELPWLTQMIVDLSYILTRGEALLVLGLLAALVVYSLASTARGKGTRGVVARLPGFSHLVAVGDIEVMMRTVENGLKRGVTLPDCLGAASLAVTTPAVRIMAAQMSEHSRKGHTVGPLLGGPTPTTAAWLFRHAEEHGNLAEACSGIADYCEEQFELGARRAVAIFEPALIALVAAAIGIIVIAFYLPLFNIPKIVGKA